MNKSQSSLIGIVLLMGIIISLVSATYVWAGPLISKNVDRSNVERTISFMNSLNDDILYVASTGASRTLSANLGQASLVIDSANNQIVVEIISAIQIINSATQVPLNFIELALSPENFNINALLIDENTIIEDYEPLSYYSSITLEGEEYNASLFNNSATNNFDLLCLWRTPISKSNDCGQPEQSIIKEEIAYEVIYINESGKTASFIGDLTDNKGIFGMEPSGIISAKGFTVSDNEYITLYLTYRALINNENTDFKIFLNCSNNCVLIDENKNLIISRKNIERGAGYVYTYINIEVI